MIRAHVPQSRVVRKLSFVTFCLSVIASTIGYGIWGYPGIFCTPILIVAALYFPFFPNASPKAVFAVFLGMLCSILSVGISDMRSNDASHALDTALRDCGTDCSAEGIILSTSAASFSIRIGAVGGKVFENTVNARIFGTADSLSEGKSVRISGIKKILSPKNGGTAYSVDAMRIFENGDSLLRVRKWIANSSDALYPRKESALARGLLFGDGVAISEESSLAYRKSGLSHLVVASGGNIAVVAGTLAIFAKRLPFLMRALLLFSGIWGYAALAGCGIPIVRAAMMASVALFSEPFFKADPIPLLFSVGAAMVLWSPETAMSASFLLSFSATLGIAVLAAKTSENLLMVPSGFSLRETLVATVSATVATIPVSLILFGSLPVLSIVSNLMVIPFLAYAAIPTI